MRGPTLQALRALEDKNQAQVKENKLYAQQRIHQQLAHNIANQHAADLAQQHALQSYTHRLRTDADQAIIHSELVKADQDILRLQHQVSHQRKALTQLHNDFKSAELTQTILGTEIHSLEPVQMKLHSLLTELSMQNRILLGEVAASESLTQEIVTDVAQCAASESYLTAEKARIEAESARVELEQTQRELNAMRDELKAIMVHVVTLIEERDASAERDMSVLRREEAVTQVELRYSAIEKCLTRVMQLELWDAETVKADCVWGGYHHTACSTITRELHDMEKQLQRYARETAIAQDAVHTMARQMDGARTVLEEARIECYVHQKEAEELKRDIEVERHKVAQLRARETALLQQVQSARLEANASANALSELKRQEQEWLTQQTQREMLEEAHAREKSEWRASEFLERAAAIVGDDSIMEKSGRGQSSSPQIPRESMRLLEAYAAASKLRYERASATISNASPRLNAHESTARAPSPLTPRAPSPLSMYSSSIPGWDSVE